MKKMIGSITLLLIAVMFVSCAGIGDGALIGNIDQSGIDTSEYALVSELRFYDANGTFEAGCDIDNEDANEIRELFLNGEYVEGLDRNSIIMDYVEVFFRWDKHTNLMEGTVYDGEYRIYSDGYVIQETSSGTVQKGHLDGVYEKLTAYLPVEITLEISKSPEAEAGFSFSSLMIMTEPGKNYTASDFPEIDCISVKSLMSTEEISWWVLTLDSDTEKEILDSLEKLKARDDIKNVELDYIMTID